MQRSSTGSCERFASRLHLGGSDGRFAVVWLRLGWLALHGTRKYCLDSTLMSTSASKSNVGEKHIEINVEPV